MQSIEAEILQRIEAVFVRCPELFRFSVRDRSGLPDHIDPTTLEGELFIFEIALAPRFGKGQYDAVYAAITAAISAGLMCFLAACSRITSASATIFRAFASTPSA